MDMPITLFWVNVKGKNYEYLHVIDVLFISSGKQTRKLKKW